MGDLLAGDDVLEKECRTFCRYLTGDEPTAYILRKYRSGQESIPFRSRNPGSPFETLLVVFAGKGTVRARMGDAYARIFLAEGLLRQKLVLLLAILETSPTTYPPLTRGGRGLARAIRDITISLAGFGLSFLGALLVLGPMHILRRSRLPHST
jgi:hypothetical protein